MDSASNPITEDKVNLGRMLYYDARLSRGQDVSCNTCHALDKYGVDDEALSTGFKGQKGARNAPTVYNAAGHFVQFWDGRAPTVEEQAKGPILNPVEMAMTDQKRVIQVLRSMPEYVEAFKKAFPGAKDPLTFDNVGLAIGAFERKLVTSARWDKFLGGDQTALTDQEKAGLNAFLDAGCQACHNGAFLGGSVFQKLGAAKPYPDTKDLGPLRRHPTGRRQAGVQSPQPAQCREDRALLPRWLGEDDGRSGGENGRLPIGQVVIASGCDVDHIVPENPYRRPAVRVHQGTRAAQEHGEDAQTGEGVSGAGLLACPGYAGVSRPSKNAGSKAGGRPKGLAPHVSPLTISSVKPLIIR